MSMTALLLNDDGKKSKAFNQDKNYGTKLTYSDRTIHCEFMNLGKLWNENQQL
jgi:hypothetical protein